MKILVVEDDKVSGALMKGILEKFGECELAVTGDEALSKFSSALESGSPYALITLDIMMPGKDGHEVLKFIREQERTAGIEGLDGVKVIMTSALGDSKNVLGAFKEGCEAYLTKPIDRKMLVSKLEEFGLLKAG